MNAIPLLNMIPDFKWTGKPQGNLVFRLSVYRTSEDCKTWFASDYQTALLEYNNELARQRKNGGQWQLTLTASISARTPYLDKSDPTSPQQAIAWERTFTLLAHDENGAWPASYLADDRNQFKKYLELNLHKRPCIVAPFLNENSRII